MTKERLAGLSLESLNQLAQRRGIRLPEDADRSTLIEQILEVEEEERIDRLSEDNMAMKVEEKKFDTNPEEDITPEEGDEYSLPESYNETRLVLLLRDPYWAFAYWDIEQAELEKLRTESGGELFLRVFETSGSDTAAQFRGEFFDIPVTLEDKSWYINLPRCGINFFVQLATRNRDGVEVLCISNLVRSPRMSLVTQDSQEFETLEEILVATGIVRQDESNSGIPQRIISLLDTQYLHLQG